MRYERLTKIFSFLGLKCRKSLLAGIRSTNGRYYTTLVMSENRHFEHKKRIEENHFNKRTGSEVKLSHQTPELAIESHHHAEFELCIH